MLAALATALTACASGSFDQLTPPFTGLEITPAALELSPGETAQFTATAGDAALTDVVWSVAEASAGSVTAKGLYTATDAPGTYHVLARSADASKRASAVVTVKAPGSSSPSRQGTGTAFGASYVTGATGGGAMPSWSENAVTASCAGDGATDDTSCLQAAANAARDQGKVLAIPAKPSFYRLTGPVKISTSVGGVGGTPVLKQTNTSATYGAQEVLLLARGMTGWVYNLHLVGTFDGSNAVTEFGHLVDVGSVNGVTLLGNVLENAMGDAIGTDVSRWDGGSGGQNVLVDGNTIRNPYRCAVAFVYTQRNWTIVNNLMDKPVNYVSAIDIEPEAGGSVVGVEIAYNRFVMDNRTPNPSRGADGKAVFAWQTPNTASPGGNYYLHHNYGTFGTGFFGLAGAFGYVLQVSNVEGASVPP
jgi:hypothetical protein